MEERKENKLGTAPIPRLLAGMAIPLIAANIVSALYNVVDGIYVSRLSSTALAATTLAFPAQIILMAVSSGTAGGMNSLLSRRLGARRFDAVNHVASHGIVLSLMSYLVFLLAGLFLSRWFIGLFTKDAALLQQGVSYLSICYVGALFVFLTYVFTGMLQATGRTGLCMAMQVAGAVVNIVLDPILIFGRFGLPAMGIAGAALATVIGQACGAVLGLVFNLAGNRDVSIRLKGFRFEREIVGEIYKVGVPSMLMMSVGSLMNIGMNKILIGVSEAAVSVFGVYYKLQSFVFMPVFGIVGALVPIVGYNFGASRPDRIRQVVRMAILLSFSIMAVGTVVFQLFPDKLLAMFTATREMYEIGIPAMRIISITFMVAAICICLGDALTGMGVSYVSAINSFIRQLIVLLPSAFLFARLFGIHYVWYSFVLAEVASLTVTLVLFVRLWRKMVVPMEKQAAQEVA